MNMIVDSGISILLPKGRTLSLHDPRRVCVQVDRGRLWLTESGKRTDYFIAAGESHLLDGGGTAVLEGDGDEPAVLRLAHTPVLAQPGAGRAPPRTQSLQPGTAPPQAVRWLAAVRRFLSRLGTPLRAWRRSRRLAREQAALLELSDRTLSDLGAPDWLIERASRHRFERKLQGELERRGLSFWQQRW